MQANCAHKRGAEEEAERLLAAARCECEQLRIECNQLRCELELRKATSGVSVHDDMLGTGALSTGGKVKGQHRKELGVNKAYEVLSVPVICALQALCVLVLLVLHLWP